MVTFDTIYPFSRLRQGKFRNIEFSVTASGETSGGRKTVTHEYPNTDRRFVEDLGKRKKTYTIEAYIDTTTNNQIRDNFIRVLDTKGTGKLIHPWYGQKTVSVKGYTISDNFGWSRFNITFEESDPSILPETDLGKKSLLEKIKDEIKDLQETRVGEVFSAIGQGKKVFTAGSDKVKDFSEQMLEVSNAVLNVTDDLGILQRTINDTLNNTALLIKTPTELGTRISNLFTQFELIGERAKNQFDATKGLFGFGEDDVDLKVNTFNERLIKSNSQTINIATRANALALGYETALNISYNNDEELDEIKAILENEYQSLISIADEETLDLLKDLRSQAELVFQDLEKTVPKIYSINFISIQNIHQIVFNYYGNFANSQEFEDKVEQIWVLNDFTNPSKIRGEVKLLT